MSAALWTKRVAIIATCGSLVACAGQIKPSLQPTAARSDALLILPGFGYSRDAEEALSALRRPMKHDGFDLYVPSYISRRGLDKSRSTLREFVREQRLDQYERVHVFAFLAGGWSLNPLVDAQELPNLATVVYDRSPLQERAARIATDDLHILTWIRYGSPVFDFARTPYPPLTRPGVNVGLVVETRPTPFVQRHESAARRYGSFDFECDALLQPHEDCLYLPMHHGEVYERFAEVWPEVRAFIRTGRFTEAASRTPPEGDPFTRTRKQP
jgi:hypothetical protein